MRQLRNILLVGALCAPLITFAQFAPEPVQFSITPETPGPRMPVTITAEGVGSFLGDATVTWRENNVVKLTGAGERVFSFVTGALGSQTTIKVTIDSTVQGRIERTFIFRPSLVNLIWEADTTAPLFYRGKTLYSAGSTLKVVAFPTVIVNNALVSTRSLSFQWTRNDEPLPAQSGLGRNTLTFAGDQLQSGERVRVEVYFGSARVGEGSIFIPAQKPLAVLYNRDPLQGITLNAAFPAAIALTGNEITLQVEPYFFSRQSKSAGLLNYTWMLNNEETTGPDTARGLLTLRQTGEGAGGASVRVSVQNEDSDKLIQAAEGTLEILFGTNQSSGSLFGI